VTEAELMAEIRDLAGRLHLVLFWPGPQQVQCWGPGWPDLAICGRRLLLREVKGDGGTVHPRQKAWGYALRGCGEDWSVWWPDQWRSGDIENELKGIRR
jgi:hypothetical protein